MRPSDVTPKSVYLRRREFLKVGAGSALALSLPAFARAKVEHGPKLAGVTVNPAFALAEEKKNSFEDITTYNNFYELGMDKSDPSENAAKLQTRPWTLSVEGEVGKPRKWDIEEILKAFPVEERVYRLRCVEAWSMIIPWVGFPLADLLKRFEPKSTAKFVQFLTLADRNQMPVEDPFDFGGQFSTVLLCEGKTSVSSAARIGVGIRAAADGDQRDRAWGVRLDSLLRVTGPIAADLVELTSQRGAVTGVGRHHRAHLAVATGRAENGQRLVRRPAGRAAIPRERDLPFVPRQPGRFPVGQRRQGHLLQLVSQLFAVAFNGRLLIGGDWHRENVGGETHDPRAAVGVRGTNREPLARQAGLLSQPRRHFVDNQGRDAAVVHRDQDRRTLPGTANGQALGPKPLFDPFRLRFAHGVTGQADRVVRRDIHSRDANPESDVCSCDNTAMKDQRQKADKAEGTGKHVAIVGE